MEEIMKALLEQMAELDRRYEKILDVMGHRRINYIHFAESEECKQLRAELDDNRRKRDLIGTAIRALREL